MPGRGETRATAIGEPPAPADAAAPVETDRPRPGAPVDLGRASGGGRTVPARDAVHTRAGGAPSRLPAPGVPPGTTELGIDIIKVARIAETLRRFGARFSARVLTPGERRYVRDRPETFAGRWAAKEAVSKVLGLGVRGIGWRDIEIERLPTGQPAVRLHGRAAGRADQLGMDRIAVSISHEDDYAVAIAFGIRSAGGRYVFPLDIEERLDERERRILARMERLRALAAGEGPRPDGEGERPGGEDGRPGGGEGRGSERGRIPDAAHEEGDGGEDDA